MSSSGWTSWRPVVITFPENLSADSFGDLRAYLDLFIKKMRRRAKGSQKDEAAN
jgi:hypothetical protein